MDKKHLKVIIIILIMLSVSISTSFASKLVDSKVAKNSESDYRYVIEVNGKYGLIDKAGKIILKPKYGMIGDFHEGMAPVCNYVYDGDGEPSETHCGAINTNGELNIPLLYDSSFNFYNGLAYVEKNKQSFLINKNGKIIARNLFFGPEKQITVESTGFKNGKALAYSSDSNKMGVINQEGKFIIKPLYDQVWGFTDGVAIFAQGESPLNRLYGFIDINGHEISSAKYLEASNFADGLAYVMLSRNNSKVETGYIDKKGKLVFKNTYKNIEGPYYYEYSFHDGMVANPECNYMNKQGEVIFGLKELGLKPASSASSPDKCTDFNEDLLKVLYSKNNFVGFLDKKGNLVIKTESKNVEDFSEGLVAIEKNGKWGFVDKTGKFVIKPIFDNPLLSFDPPQSDPRDIIQAVPTLSFKDGLAFVCQGNICGYIDKSAKFIWSKKVR